MRTGRLWAWLGLVATTAFAAWATFAHQFRFFINPDSYYYLMIAKNLVADGSPVGTLGPAGMPFPPQGYAAMKATFPLLAAVPIALGIDAEATGHLVASLALVVSVPLAFVATRRLMGSERVALAASALVATSWGLVYWAGFVMSDSTSVALAFALIAAVARLRRDELMNPGDLVTGAVAALLLLSRPTYVVALPMLFWLGWRRFGWSARRLGTAGATAGLLVSAVSVVWFPPAAFGASVLVRLAPLLAGAAAFAWAAMWLLASGGRGARALYWICALAVPCAVLIGFGLYWAGAGPSPSGLANFGARDAATIALVLLGAWALRHERRDAGGALLVSAAALLGVCLWADPRESRYLVHLLPLLVPVAAAAVQLRVPRAPSLAAALLVLAVGWQGARVARGSSAAFLETDYPTQVVAQMGEVVGGGEILVTALPWPYHFRTGMSVWNAEPSTIARFTRYIPSESHVLVLADAALEFHDGPLAAAVAVDRAAALVSAFEVPARYAYGYVGAPSNKPVRVYRMRAKDLRRIAESVEDIPTPDRDAEQQVR